MIEVNSRKNKSKLIVFIGVSTPPQKHHHLLSCQAPLKSANCPSPHFRQSTPLYWFFVNTPLKVRFSSEPPKYYSFSSLIPSYLLKVTKFLGKISQFEFFVMTEKNIFAYKLFLSLNVSDFNLFLCENCNPPLKVEVLSRPPF